jgi:hypothetical protein
LTWYELPGILAGEYFSLCFGTLQLSMCYVANSTKFVNSQDGRKGLLRLFPVEAECFFFNSTFSKDEEKLFLDAGHCPVLLGVLHTLVCAENTLSAYPFLSVCPSCFPYLHEWWGHCCTPVGRYTIVKNIFAQQLPHHVSARMA